MRQSPTQGDKKIPVSRIELPKGGGAIRGLGETFRADAFSGTASLSIPVPSSACRGFEPRFDLEYNSGSGNDIFGLGFSLTLPYIGRKTERRIPQYNAQDTFLLSGADDLVPQLIEHDGKWIPDETAADPDPETGRKFHIVRFRPRTEGLFARIEQWREEASGDIHWRVTTKDNATSIYGSSQAARIFDPSNPGNIFQWLIEKTMDARGNRISYEYRAEDGSNILDSTAEARRVQTANKYIHKIKYGNYPAGQEKGWHFEIVFDYGERNFDHLDDSLYEPKGTWKQRGDPFSSYRSGFEIRTYRRCDHVLIFHRFAGECDGKPFLVRALHFDYAEDSSLTLLRAVREAGYHRHPDGKYEVKELPPLEFQYSKFGEIDAAAGSFARLTIEDRPVLPGFLDQNRFQLVDLYGEGIPGLLYTESGAVLFWRPQGGGCFQSAVTPSQIPIELGAGRNDWSFVDLAGDGKLELLVESPRYTGFYEIKPDGSWSPYASQDSLPVEVFDRGRQMVDVTGDGLADLLMIEEDQIKVYPSLGRQGYGSPFLCPNGNKLPVTAHHDAREAIQFADLFGDGGSHLVRIRNGCVECWPNLGYGRFGPAVTFDNAPQFGAELDASRLFLADIDGSGAVDLIHACSDHLDIYFNRSGSGFSEPVSIPLPERYSDIGQIQFADVLGNGTACLVFTAVNDDLSLEHYYYDFTGGVKPYLLNSVDNNLGATTHISYSPSTRFYLADKKAGTPWITRLPFPVQVVEQVETIDRISDSRLVTSYTYHHGYFDPIDREFRGFGRVEAQDAETLSAHSQPTDVPPVLTKTWHHTGAWQEEGSLAQQYRPEYFQKDAGAYWLPDHVFDYGSSKPDTNAQREACQALKGAVLRQEVYGLDHSPLETVPYSVTETNYRVRQLQSKEQNEKGVYFVHAQESLAYHYERNPDNPRVQHDFVLDITPFGNVTKACTVHYGRRRLASPDIHVHPEQAELKAIAQLAEFIEVTEPFRLIGIPCEAKTLELNGLDLQGQPYFGFDQIRRQVNEALDHQIPYGEAFSAIIRQACLLSWQQSYFWNPAQDGALPLSQLTEQALLHHQQQAVFSNEWLEKVYQDRLDKKLLSQEGGYFEEDGCWWDKGLVQHYLPAEGFYLPSRTENDFAVQAAQADGLRAKTSIGYDDYYLAPVQIETSLTDKETNVVTAVIDYYTLAPWQLTEENGVIRQVLFDPLGMVVAASVFKEAEDSHPREGDGDLRLLKIPTGETFEDVIAHPAQYLQEATSLFYYDLFAWRERQQPPSYISLERRTHVSDLEPGTPSLVRVSLGYSDGFGREIESKLAVEPGQAILRDGAGKLELDQNLQPVQAEAAERWLVSGRTVYNNKGQPAKQYLPYFSNTARYETQQEIVAARLVPPPTVIYYDPLSRAIKRVTPKGFFSKVEFTPWESRHYDENDTVKDSAYYQEFFKNYPAVPTEEQKNEKDALEKAAAFYNTPEMMALDSLGNVFLEIQNNLGAVSQEAFNSIVTGLVTSKEVWDLLVEKGYLAQDGSTGWLTNKFEPYRTGFKDSFLADLPEQYKSFGEAILDLLRQNCLTTYHQHDIQGREIVSIDPRLYYSNRARGTSYCNFRYEYPMAQGNPVSVDSADAGKTLSLNNIFGSFVWNLSPRNFEQVTEYDRLQRKTRIRVKGLTKDGTAATDNIVETYTYGEAQPQAKANNLRGRLYRLQDQSGEIINSKYNLQGQVLETTRQFTILATSRQSTQKPKICVNWGAAVDLEKDQYSNRYTFNALQQLLTETTPDGSVTTNIYKPGGELDQVRVQFKDGTSQSVIDRIDYNANRQRTGIVYANGVKTTYSYEDTTLHLTRLYSARPDEDARGNKRKTALQDIVYVYDPVGNITRIYDQAYATIFYKNQKVDARSDYTYDALYRLIKSGGRQHPGINAGTYRNNEKDGDFKQSKYIPLNNAEALENYQERYSYDEADNLIETAHSASNSWTRTRAIMPDSNRLKTIDSGNGIQASQEVRYDASGNMQQLSINSSVNLIWSCCENLVGAGIIERPEEPDDRDYYTYDSDELRTRKVSERMANRGALAWKEEKKYLGNYEVKLIRKEIENGETTVLTRNTLRVMDDRTCVAILHYWEKDDLQREVDRPGTQSLRYQLDNHLGSVSLEVDRDAEIISYEEYFPYGGTALIAGNNQREVKLKEYRYSGKERDDSTGLYYYGARYYAPWLGRWISPDPAGRVDGLNLFEFVRSNPILVLDPEGRAAQASRPLPHRAMHPGYETVGGKIVKEIAAMSPQAKTDMLNSLRMLELEIKAEKTAGGLPIHDEVRVRGAVAAGLSRDYDTFDRLYHAADPGKDEHLSTTSVGHILLGAGAELGLHPDRDAPEMITTAVITASHLRSETGETGHNITGGSAVQHPTSATEAMHAARGFGHNIVDRERRAFALMAAQDPKLQGPIRIIRAAARATLFTVNAFMGPASASNVALMPGISPARAAAQTAKREATKRLCYPLAGCVVDRKRKQPFNADYHPDPHARSPSPTRVPIKRARP